MASTAAIVAVMLWNPGQDTSPPVTVSTVTVIATGSPTAIALPSGCERRCEITVTVGAFPGPGGPTEEPQPAPTQAGASDLTLIVVASISVLPAILGGVTELIRAVREREPAPPPPRRRRIRIRRSR
jgi:hypothetical protein